MNKIDGDKIKMIVEEIIDLFERWDVTPNEAAAITGIIDLNIAATLGKEGECPTRINFSG